MAGYAFVLVPAQPMRLIRIPARSPAQVVRAGDPATSPRCSSRANVLPRSPTGSASCRRPAWRRCQPAIGPADDWDSWRRVQPASRSTALVYRKDPWRACLQAPRRGIRRGMSVEVGSHGGRLHVQNPSRKMGGEPGGVWGERPAAQRRMAVVEGAWASGRRHGGGRARHL
jgi:hypothetical protein